MNVESFEWLMSDRPARLKLSRRLGTYLSPRLRGTLALSVPIFCTVMIFAAWRLTRIAVRQARSWVDHTEQVIFSANRTQLGLARIESDLRRHVITGASKDPQQYQHRQREVTDLAETVHRLVADNPTQQEKWRIIQDLVDRRFMYLSQLLALQQQDSRVDARTIEILEQGQVVMEDLRQSLSDFQEEERRLLVNREQQLEKLLSISMIIGWSLLFGSLLSSLAAVYLFRGLDSAHESQGIQLQQSQHMLNAIADSVVDGVITLRPDGTVAKFNRAAQNMFGYDQLPTHPLAIEDLLKVQPLDMSHQEDQQDASHHLFETQGIRQDGILFPIEVSVSNLAVNQQQFLMIRDISERRAAKESLEKSAQELQHLNDILCLSNQALMQRNEELDQFAYLASHDLKAPLRAITNLSTWIEEDIESQLGHESRHLFELLRGRALRLEKLIDALADYARLGQQPIELTDVDVAALLKEIIAQHVGAEQFTFKLSPELPTLQAHRDYLTIIFSQLVDNAIRFHPSGAGVIRIEAEAVEAGWQFSVIDDGEGIDPKYHDRIFRVFQTLNSRDTVESTGIGLAIVTKILKIVGGSIHVTSELGQGAAFHFIWPQQSASGSVSPRR